VRLLAASAALTLVGYAFVSFPQGHGWGSRYFYPAWMVLPVFAALWITSGRPAARAVRGRVLGGLALASLALLNTVAMVQMNRFITGQLQQLPEVTTLETPVVVLLDASKGYYVGDLIHNDPMLRRSPIFLRSEGEAADAAFMAEHFPALRLESRHAHGTVWAPPGRSR
jgi:hypothetical protein